MKTALSSSQQLVGLILYRAAESPLYRAFFPGMEYRILRTVGDHRVMWVLFPMKGEFILPIDEIISDLISSQA